MNLTIKRVAQTDEGTFGVLIDNYGTPFALTIERPWLDNQPSVSCIPEGNYTCQRVNSPHFGDTFEVLNVPNRSHILFHKGNLMDDSHGCIIVGEQFGVLEGKAAVLSSKAGYNEFKALLNGYATFNLSIITV